MACGCSLSVTLWWAKRRIWGAAQAVHWVHWPRCSLVAAKSGVSVSCSQCCQPRALRGILVTLALRLHSAYFIHGHREGNEERQIVLSKTFISSHPKWLLFIFFIHDDGYFTLIMSVSIFPKCPALYPCALCTLTPLHHSRGATPLHSPLSQTPSLTRTSSWSLCSKYRAGESLWDHIAESSINSFTSKL